MGVIILHLNNRNLGGIAGKADRFGLCQFVLVFLGVFAVTAVNVFVLIDVRLEPQKIDLEFIEWLGLSSVPFAIVFTKADKLTPNKARQAVEAYKKTLLETWEELPPIFLTSAEKREGRDEVLQYIEQINKDLKAE